MLQQALEALLEGHGIETVAYKDWITVGGQFPAVRASIHDRREQDGWTLLRLDVEVAVSAEKVIVESFAGRGEGERAAVRNALENFCINSLHVFLAAFWGHIEPDQVEIEGWQVGGGNWRAVVGNVGCQSFGGEAVEIPNDFFPTIESCIKSLALAGDLHWVRSFHCNIGGDDSCTEVLLDNEPWPLAQTAVARLDWPRSEGYYSARNFLVLQRL